VKEWAFVHHLWERNGYRPGMRIAVLRGVKIANVDRQPWEFDGALSELRLSPFHLVPEIMGKYCQLLEQYKIRFIWGYPSAISIFANYALSKGWQCPSTLTGVIPISETLFPHQREIIYKAFRGIRILASYGLSEKVAIAGELPAEEDVYEFEPLYGITELVDDDGMPVTELGKSGRIIGTGFISTAMPLLRYDTGDLGELVRPASKRNCYRLQLKGIKSRWGQEFIVAENGALISIAAVNIHSNAYSNIQSFQFSQDAVGRVTVLVVPVIGCTKEDIQPFVDEIQAKVGRNVRFNLKVVTAIAGNDRGKRRFIDQKLDLSKYR
jgi:phenylacetate-CoA ligase